MEREIESEKKMKRKGVMEIRGGTMEHKGKRTEPKVTKFYQIQHALRLFTSVCFIERKRKKLRRGVGCGNCFREWAVIQVSELFVFVLSAPAITA